jgi:hypothetical protein
VGLRVYNGAPVADAMREAEPGCTADNFLHPVHVEPEALTLEEVKAITKREALRRPNYFLYDEDETTPPVVLRIGTALLRVMAPRQPLWRLHVLLRTVQQRLGIAAVRRMLHKRRSLPTGDATAFPANHSKGA